MTLHEAKQLTMQLMEQHGVLANGWEFQWSNAKGKFGSVSIRGDRKKLRLSRHAVLMNDDALVRDTILHEIAHILVGFRHGHNHVFKAKCREIGAIPQRCGTGNMPDKRYVIQCNVCGRDVAQYHRRPRKNLTMSYHAKCGKQSLGQLKLVDLENYPNE